MLKRALFFSTPYCLSLRNGQMVIAEFNLQMQQNSD